MSLLFALALLLVPVVLALYDQSQSKS